ncbi:MAG: hypothetical protein GXN94_00440 [Aquificae bacterium]|nr:hypothetical protein [Aquificota bacterium]
MDIIKNLVAVLSGTVVYIFIFAGAGVLLPVQVVKEHFLPVSLVLFIAGFLTNVAVNRFLFSTGTVKSVVFAFLSFLVLVVGTVIWGMFIW